MSKENCTLTKIYTFSAAHRLHNEKFSDQMNQEIFGKCNNKNGHGHDYTLELTVKSNIDDDTGMIVDLRLLDRAVEPLIEELDHKRLDVQIDYFLQVRASGENIAKYIWMNLVDKIPKPATRAIVVVVKANPTFLKAYLVASKLSASKATLTCWAIIPECVLALSAFAVTLLFHLKVLNKADRRFPTASSAVVMEAMSCFSFSSEV